ncbi:MAG: arginase family protein [Candidatus Geothermincolia bacterium]
MTFAAFGCALDVLDAPEKIAMKLAYVNALREGLISDPIARDPFDLLMPALEDAPGLVTVGKLEIEPWFTPRPGLEGPDNIDILLYREFLDTGGCAVVSARLREFVRDRVLPLSPVLLGVDHSLTEGVLEALELSGENDLALIVLDSHFDAIPASVRKAAAIEPGAAGTSEDEGAPPDSFTCGNWLARVLDKGLVKPQRVAVVGPSDHPGPAAAGGEPEAMAAYREAYLELEERGVTVIPKKRVKDLGVEEAAREAVSRTGGSSFYISIDADIGAGVEAKAVRFLDTIGIDPDDVVRLCRSLAGEIASRGGTIAGFDIMEIDVHLADIPGSGDRTVEMAAAAAREMLAAAGG